MTEFLRMYIVGLVIFLGVDAVWLTVIAKSFYAKHLGYLMTDKPNLLAALVFYLINIVGLLTFVIVPSLHDKTLFRAVYLAALYGFCTYAAYDLTNLATIKNWPPIVTIIDLIWGVTITILVAVGTLLVAKRFI